MDERAADEILGCRAERVHLTAGHGCGCGHSMRSGRTEPSSFIAANVRTRASRRPERGRRHGFAPTRGG
jgi:hypothetical protein